MPDSNFEQTPKIPGQVKKLSDKIGERLLTKINLDYNQLADLLSKMQDNQPNKYLGKDY